MNHRNKYSIFDREKIVAFIALLAVLITVVVAITVSVCKGEDALVKCWVMCKPETHDHTPNYVHVRRTPSKNGMEVGYLDAGDWFMTDGTSADGWIRCYDIGEYGEGWVYCGYVVTEEPEAVMDTYVCCAPKRVACRRWMNGPQVSGCPWLTNLSKVYVYYIADGWACTSQGYIKAEYLEASPE